MKYFSVILCALAGLGVLAQTSDLPNVDQNLTVLGSKSEIPRDQFGGTVHIVTAEDIERYQWRSVADVLHRLPGVSLAQTGGDGGVTTVFLRGAKSEDTLVLLNGVKLNDPSGVGRGYDFAHLSTAGIARIELILGPQSTLYGSDASAGVVNIVMSEGSEPYFTADLEASDESSQRARLGFGSHSGDFKFSGGIEYSDSQSISARAAQGQQVFEEDGFENLNAHVNLGYDLAGARRLGLGVSFVDTESDADASSGDDPNFITDYRQTAVNASYEDAPNENWNYGLHLKYARIERGADDRVDEINPFDAILSDFEGTNTALEFRNHVALGGATRLTAGLSYEREEGMGDTAGESAFGPFFSTFSEDAEMTSLFAQVHSAWDSGFHVTAGMRFDEHSEYGGQTTYQASSGYRFASLTRLRASFGTGFRAPSIFQLYSDFGNTELTEETSESFELGLDQTLAQGRVRLGATYFDNSYEDLIDFFFDPVTFEGAYFNIDQVDTDGFEVFVEYRATSFQARLTYEDLNAEDVSPDPLTGLVDPIPLIRRFEDKTSLLLSGGLWEDNLRWSLDILAYGESLDNDFSTFPSTTVRLDNYLLANLGLTYRINRHVQINGRADNLTDESYETVLGYGNHGRRLFLGLKVAY